VQLLGKISRLLEDVTDQHIPAKATATLAHVDEVLSDIQHALKGADVVKLSADAQSTMSQFSGAATRLNGLIERLQGDKGVIAASSGRRVRSGTSRTAATESGGTSRLRCATCRRLQSPFRNWAMRWIGTQTCFSRGERGRHDEPSQFWWIAAILPHAGVRALRQERSLRLSLLQPGERPPRMQTPSPQVP